MNNIANLIMRDRYHRNFVLNNWTPPGWFECDVFEVTKAGFFREYEIKISRSDFKADGSKSHSGGAWDTVDGRLKWIPKVGETKHQRLARGDVKGPSRFYFVTPAGLLKGEEIPAWAGHIEWHEPEQQPWHTHKPRTSITVVKEAPVLHRSKFQPERQAKLFQTCYWRLHTYKRYEPNADNNTARV
jgi:hypothetical protein